MSDKLYDVFISHSSKDKAIAEQIASRLKHFGLHVWFDSWEILVVDCRSIIPRLYHVILPA